MRGQQVYRIPLLVALTCLSACSSKRKTEAPAPKGPDYASMTQVKQVDEAAPPELKVAYQNLFSCTLDLAVKEGRPTPEINPQFAGRILETVRKDPTAGDKCLSKLRAGGYVPGDPVPAR